MTLVPAVDHIWVKLISLHIPFSISPGHLDSDRQTTQASQLCKPDCAETRARDPGPGLGIINTIVWAERAKYERGFH